jgi:hypothetical protein
MHREMADLIAVLRSALQDVQDSVWNDSPAILEMKRRVLQTIIELEADLKEGQSPHLLTQELD